MAEDQARGALVSLRSRREAVIDLLCDSYASDLLGEEELENRLDLVHRATDLTTLDDIVRDIEVPRTESPIAIAPLPDAIVVGGRRRDTKTIAAVMGAVSRQGGWRAPRKLRVVAVMGGAEIDFREVALPSGVTEVSIFAMMGGVDIIVPPHVAVECEGVAIMGGFETIDRAPRADGPIIRISGLALMGGVDVSTRLPGESARQARRRRKRESKARARAAQRTLPS